MVGPVASEQSPAQQPAGVTLDAVRAEMARRSLASFFQQAWHVLEPSDPLIWNWHLQAICDHVQALFEGRIPSNNLAVAVPPGSSKSRIVSVCGLSWWWIEHPEFRAIHTSANPRVVIRDSILTRQLITSQWYQHTFKPTWRLAGDQNAKVLYRNTAGGFRLAVGAGAAITGDRAHGLFMDDMLDAALGESKAERESFATWYDLAFANRLSSATKGIRCLIGQRLHEADPMGHVTKGGDWEELVIRQEFDPGQDAKDEKDGKRRTTSLGWRDPRKLAGELMDPVRYPRKVLDQERRRLGSRGYSSQQQQAPSPAAGTIVQRAWFKWYKTPRDGRGDPLPPLDIVKALGITRVVQGVDTALSEKTTADNTADCTIGEAAARYYVLDLWQDKVGAPAGRAMIVSLRQKWMAHAVPIEGGSSASGKAAVQTIHADSTLPVIEMPVIADKVVGLNAVAPTIEAGVVYLPEDQPWAHDLLESLVKFPAGAHDDDVDAFRIALGYLLFGGGATGMLDFMRSQQQRALAAASSKPT